MFIAVKKDRLPCPFCFELLIFLCEFIHNVFMELANFSFFNCFVLIEYRCFIVAFAEDLRCVDSVDLAVAVYVSDEFKHSEFFFCHFLRKYGSLVVAVTEDLCCVNSVYLAIVVYIASEAVSGRDHFALDEIFADFACLVACISCICARRSNITFNDIFMTFSLDGFSLCIAAVFASVSYFTVFKACCRFSNLTFVIFMTKSRYFCL